MGSTADNCLTCDSVTPYLNDNCLTCPSSLPVLVGSRCRAECSSGTFVRNGVCRPCDVNCAECSGSPIFCTACTGDFPFLRGSECVASCSSSEYVDGNVCRACSSNCVTCRDANTCLSCPASLPYLENGVCVACPPGQSLINGQCQASVTPSPSASPSPAPVAASASSAPQRSSLPPPPPAEVVQPSFRPANPVVTPSESRTPVTPTPVFTANRDYVIVIADQDEASSQNSGSVASWSALLLAVVTLISLVF